MTRRRNRWNGRPSARWPRDRAPAHGPRRNARRVHLPDRESWTCSSPEMKPIASAANAVPRGAALRDPHRVHPRSRARKARTASSPEPGPAPRATAEIPHCARWAITDAASAALRRPRAPRRGDAGPCRRQTGLRKREPIGVVRLRELIDDDVAFELGVGPCTMRIARMVGVWSNTTLRCEYGGGQREHTVRRLEAHPFVGDPGRSTDEGQNILRRCLGSARRR